MNALDLKCEMRKECVQGVTHIDNKGFIYCRFHGQARKESGYRCRMLTGGELKKLNSGQQLAHY